MSKYRGWDKENKIIVTGEEEYLNDTYDGIFSNEVAMLNRCLEHYDFIMMESTDVEDINNQLIFERDLVELYVAGKKYIGEVVKRLGSLLVKYDGICTPIYTFVSKENRKSLPAHTDKLKVVGNSCSRDFDSKESVIADVEKAIESITKGIKRFNEEIEDRIEYLKDSLTKDDGDGMYIGSFRNKTEDKKDDIENNADFIIGKQDIYDKVTILDTGIYDAYQEIVKVYRFFKFRMQQLFGSEYSLKSNVLEINAKELHYDQILELLYNCLDEIKETYKELK